MLPSLGFDPAPAQNPCPWRLVLAWHLHTFELNRKAVALFDFARETLWVLPSLVLRVERKSLSAALWTLFILVVTFVIAVPADAVLDERSRMPHLTSIFRCA